MKHVISYALFEPPGSDRLWYYFQCLPTVLRSAFALYPGWEKWIYHDGCIFKQPYGAVLARLHREGHIRLVYVDEPVETSRAMLWRLLPLWDGSVHRFICRDLDSIHTLRERKCVEEWVQSNERVHGISDRGVHNIPLMGGMCGFQSPLFRTLPNVNAGKLSDLVAMLLPNDRTFVDYPEGWKGRGVDQRMLGRVIWANTHGNAVLHNLAGASLCGDVSEARVFARVPDIEIPGVAQAGLAGSDDQAQFIGAPGFAEGAKSFFEQASAESVAPILTAEARHEPAPRQEGRNQWVLLPTDKNPHYAFPTPIAALLYRIRTHLQPIVLLTGTLDGWRHDPKYDLVLMRCLEAGARIEFISEIDGYANSTVAKHSMMMAGCLDLPEGDIVMASSVDQWMLGDIDLSYMTKSVRIFWANMQSTRYQGMPWFPTGHQAATIAAWRAITGVQAGGMAQQAEAILDAEVGKGEDRKPQFPHRNGIGYYSEESWFNKVFHVWEGYPDQAEFIDRKIDEKHMPEGRVNRGFWPATQEAFNAAMFWDSHINMPAHSEPGWSLNRWLIEQAAPEWLAWADEYHAEWVA